MTEIFDGIYRLAPFYGWEPSMRRIAILAAIALILSGCVSAGTKVDQSKAAAFERGKTTYADVIAALGAPNSDTAKSDGTRIIVYTHIYSAARPQSFIPIVGPLVAKADSTTDSYYFAFDASGILTSSGATHTTATSGIGG